VRGGYSEGTRAWRERLPSGGVRFSVIIPAYNAETTIRRAVDSALEQTGADFEVVVCDDGSTDATGDILAGYGDQIVVVTKPNGGLASARNAAIGASSGDWLVLLDADDEWSPGRLRAIDQAITDDVDVVTTDATVKPGGQRWYESRPFPTDRQDVHILEGSFIFGGAAIRRAAHERVGGFDESHRANSEYELWVRLLLTGSRAALVPEPLAVYHRAPTSMSGNRGESWRRVLAVLDRAERDHTLTGEQQRAVDAHRRLARHLAAVGDAVKQRTRRAYLSAATTPGPAGLRVKFLAAAIMPSLARRLG
jgi:glycosyltransferase involved in cell wall biosynthesis